MVAILYGSSTLNTEYIATKLRDAFGEERAELLNVRDMPSDRLRPDARLVFVTSTWGRGTLQDDWETFLPALEQADLAGARVALVGVGDQENYPDTFCDSIAILADIVVARGGVCVGQTDTDGYRYKQSRAERDGRFIGLVLDEDNQSDLTDERIGAWVRGVHRELA